MTGEFLDASISSFQNAATNTTTHTSLLRILNGLVSSSQCLKSGEKITHQWASTSFPLSASESMEIH